MSLLEGTGSIPPNSTALALNYHAKFTDALPREYSELKAACQFASRVI